MPKMIKVIHPDSVMKELVNLIESVGSRDFLRGPKYQKEKEKFIACFFAYAIRKFSEKEYFINQLPEPDSSDFKLSAFCDRPDKNKPLETAPIQLVELPQVLVNSQDIFGAIYKIIGKKYGKYSDEDKLMLLIFSNFEGRRTYIDSIKKFIEEKQREDKYNMVWLLRFIGIDKIKGFNCEVSQLWPNSGVINFWLIDEFNRGIVYNNSYIEKYAVRQ